MIRTEIDRDEPLQPGDKIEMHFKTWGPNWVYLRASELALLKWRLEQKNPDYDLIGWEAPPAGDKLILTFLIKDSELLGPQIQQASIGTAAAIAVIVIGGGLFAWLSLDKVFKITDSPAGKVALIGTGSLGIAALVVAVLLVLRHYSD